MRDMQTETPPCDWVPSRSSDYLQAAPNGIAETKPRVALSYSELFTSHEPNLLKYKW